MSLALVSIVSFVSEGNRCFKDGPCDQLLLLNLLPSPSPSPIHSNRTSIRSRNLCSTINAQTIPFPVLSSKRVKKGDPKHLLFLTFCPIMTDPSWAVGFVGTGDLETGLITPFCRLCFAREHNLPIK